MSISERIKAIRKFYDKTQQDFADSLGLKQNTIATYEMGRLAPSDRTIADICRVYNVNEQWLRTGEGEMFLDLGPDAQLEKIFDQIQLSGDDTIRAIIRTYWGLSDQDKAVIRRVILELADQIKNGQGESPGQ